MRNYTMRLSVLVVAAVVTLFSSCSTEDTVGNVPAPNPNMVAFVAGSSDFSLFNAAVNRAGLASSLANPDITVFAPDNTAFGKIGISSTSQIDAIPVSTLRAMLTYHIVNRKVAGSALPVSDTIKTVNLQNLYASKNGNNQSYINGIKVTKTDYKVSNGLLHVIEKPLTPPSPNSTISSIVANDTTFSFLFNALTKLNLLQTFNDPGKYTVFAPTNAAFRAAGIVDINAVPVAVLENVVKSHVLGSNYFSTDLINGGVSLTLSGRSLTYAISPTLAQVKIIYSPQQFSNITATNIIATNGVIHVIARVMLP